MNKRRISKGIRRVIYLPLNRYLLYYFANKARHLFLSAIKSTAVAYPGTVMIELGNHCNLHCTTCPREYRYGHEMDKGFMPVDMAKGIIDELWPYLDSVGLTGMGETFMYNDLEEVIDHIRSKNKGIIISVSTNAVLPGFVSRVTPLIDRIDTIQVSVDGLNETYERIRKNASFDLLDQNLIELVRLCKGTNTTLMLNMVVTRENHHQMAGLVSYANKRGIRYMDFTLLNLASVTGIDSSYYRFYSSEEFSKSVAELNRVAESCKDVTVTGRNFTTEGGFRNCPFPWSHFYVCQDGYVVPCCAKPFPKEMNFGNIRDRRFLEILNSSSFRSWRQLWYENRTPDFCTNCHFIGLDCNEKV